MDQNDPEERIAELERLLAEQDRRADFRPASPDRTAASCSWAATTSRMQTWLLLCTYGVWAALVAVFTVMFAVPSARTTGWVVIVATAAGVTLFGVLGGRRWGWSKRITICAMRDGLTVDNNPGEVFSFKHAKLGRWTLGQDITVSGTALHLQCGPHSFVLGGRDHRLGTTVPLQAPPAGRVDGWLPAADFDELLTMVARCSRLDIRGPAPGEPLRCLLYPPREPMGPFAFRVKQQTPQPHLALDVGADVIRVIDANTNALVASASRAQVTAAPAIYKEVGTEGTNNVPVLVVRVPGFQPLTIRCHGAWRGKVPTEVEGTRIQGLGRRFAGAR